MSMTTANQAPVEGTVEFVQHNLPGLDPGAYRLRVTQSVSTQASPLTNSYFFAVKGSRFGLNPADIVATYPPDQAQGEFDNTLPHIVLANQTLPWQRYPTLEEPERQYPDQKHDRDIPSWLAVLVFDADDEAAYAGFRAQAKSGTVRDLFIRRAANDPNQAYSYFYAQKDLGSDSDGLARHLDYGETPDDPCQYLDIPLALFWKIAPSSDDLKMLAHLRNVNIIRKATQNGVPAGRNDLSKIPGTSDFALVFGNRVPRVGVRTFAHLVSLEGLAPFLPNDPASGDNPGEITNPSQVSGADPFTISPGGFLRLVSLQTWSFTSTGDSSHFEQLLMALRPKSTTPGAGGGPAVPDFSIGHPVPAANGTPSASAALARKALAMGYTPLQHQTRDGGLTVSWYRGPLLPYRVTTDVLPEEITSSDAATNYDPTTGMFDIGYAGAWQIGRLLAIQDKRFSALLCRWRSGNLRDAVSQMEARAVQQTLTTIQQVLSNDQVVFPLLAAFAPPVAAPVNGMPRNAVGGVARARALRGDVHRSALTSTASLSSLIQDVVAVPSEISDWLASLKLLEGVPFSYLVPDEGMLPPESIRFFYLDMNWVDALIDGALSIGRHGGTTSASPESTHDAVVKPQVQMVSSGQARTTRPTALGLTAPDPTPLEAISGFVLRSDVVKGWPGLEVNGYADDGTLLDIIRFERLAPTVLLCLFEKDGKTLHKVDIHEPAEGLHFGLSGGSSVNVRYNHQAGDQGPGSQVKGVYQPAPFRDAAGGAGGRVVRMFRLARALLDPKYRTYIDGIYEGFDHLPSSQFALQMLRGVGLVSFTSGGRTA